MPLRCATLGFLLRMCLVTSEAKVEAKFSFAIEDFSLFHVTPLLSNKNVQFNMHACEIRK